MTAQETLTPASGADGGLWVRYLTDGRINHAAWLRARASGEFVGTCRACGAFLVPGAPEDRGGGRVDYQADCRSCPYVMCAPGGRVARGSTRKSERR